MWWFIIPWQILCCFLITPLWAQTRKQIDHYFPSFQKTSPGRQQYIVKNVAKSGVLMFLSPPALWIINRIVFYNTWEQALIKCMGALYSSGDIISLVYMFDKIPITTKVHHICVLGFSVMNAVSIDYLNSTSIWRNTAVLAAFSAPTYAVNTYLGVRCLDGISDREKRRLADFALSLYTFFMSLSFGWQIFALYSQSSWTWDVYVYIVALGCIYYDDFHLSTYLWDNSNCRRS